MCVRDTIKKMFGLFWSIIVDHTARKATNSAYAQSTNEQHCHCPFRDLAIGFANCVYVVTKSNDGEMRSRPRHKLIHLVSETACVWYLPLKHLVCAVKTSTCFLHVDVFTAHTAFP